MPSDTIRHPAITGPEPYRWTLDELRAAVIAQARDDAARGVAVAPWRGVARSMERLAPDWRDDAHRHPATMGACPLDEAAEALARLYADTEEAARGIPVHVEITPRGRRIINDQAAQEPTD